MKTLKWLASASLAVVMFPALYAEPHCPGNAASIRPRFVEQSIIIVPVVLNDSGPFDFVLDTAAQVTTIDPALASDLHLKLEGTAGVTGAGFSTRASYAQLESLQVGTYAIKNSLLLIHNLGQIQVTDSRVRGILGENFLERFDLIIDYPHGIVCLDDTKQMQEKVKGEHIALAPLHHPQQNLPFTEPLIVPVAVSGLAGPPLLLQLDSGINMPLLFDPGKLHRTAFAGAPLHSRGTDGVVRAYAVLPHQDIQVGTHFVHQIAFVAPAAASRNIPDAEIDGVLPLLGQLVSVFLRNRTFREIPSSIYAVAMSKLFRAIDVLG
jgi:hypothetical protein